MGDSGSQKVVRKNKHPEAIVESYSEVGKGQ